MITVACSSFFVPPEWVAAHGFRPERLIPEAPVTEGCVACGEGMCPYARAMAHAALRDDVRAVVFAPTCDQQRRVAELSGTRRQDAATFLLHVPRVARSENCRRYYRSEIERLGRFLVEIGGRPPEREFLIETMSRFDAARDRLRRAAEARRLGTSSLSARTLAEGMVRFHRSGDPEVIDTVGRGAGERGKAGRTGRRRIALLGGPLFETDLAFFDWIEVAGGDIVLDGTENGERTLAAAFDMARLGDDPVGELVRAYFDAIPDVSRRSNDGLLNWVRDSAAAGRIDGVVLRHHVWCDQWMAEVPRIGEVAGVPVLAVDSSGRPDGRTRTRIEAFVEMLLAGVGG
ncbi:MAG TPA: 2-hydroxyacyl-CoA dehydratase family protein [Verrucomicrobiae bacterium]|nr:2-hydroxyacyl-CoA dehydratase family protein [Verrucomicrobiae bacterium]